jgi:hypothetical protein
MPQCQHLLLPQLLRLHQLLLLLLVLLLQPHPLRRQEVEEVSTEEVVEEG